MKKILHIETHCGMVTKTMLNKNVSYAMQQLLVAENTRFYLDSDL